MGLIIVDGFVITNAPVAVYGGVQVSKEELSRIADQIRHLGVPMLANHDERLRLKPRLLNVDVRPTPSGALGVWVEFETDEEAWKAASNAVGGLRGFSVSVVEVYKEATGAFFKPFVQISSDAGHWDDTLRDEVAEALSPYFNVKSSRLYQFNVEPPAKIIVEFGIALLPLIQSVGINIFSSALWDGLKLFFPRFPQGKRTEPTIIDFSAPRGNGVVHFFVRTSDTEVAKHAVDKLTEVADSSGNGFHYNEQRDRWEEEEE
jgi:hypothetical protein